jgi:hypothetical protein
MLSFIHAILIRKSNTTGKFVLVERSTQVWSKEKICCLNEAIHNWDEGKNAAISQLLSQLLLLCFSPYYRFNNFLFLYRFFLCGHRCSAIVWVCSPKLMLNFNCLEAVLRGETFRRWLNHEGSAFIVNLFLLLMDWVITRVHLL